MLAPLTPVTKLANRRAPPSDLGRYARSEFREDGAFWLVREALEGRRSRRGVHGGAGVSRPRTSVFRRLARTVFGIFL